MMAALMFVIATAMTALGHQPLPIRDGQVVPLWDGAAPDALGSDESDIPASGRASAAGTRGIKL